MEKESTIAVIMCTHNRITDAKINQEIIRHHWPGAGILSDLCLENKKAILKILEDTLSS